MSAFTALATVTGPLAFLVALWVDHSVTQQQTGQSFLASPMLAALAGVIVALTTFAFSSSLALSSAALAASSALCVAVSTDLRFGLLADLTSLIIGAAALAAAPLLTPGLTLIDMLVSAALSAGILGLAGLYGLLRRGHMGLGGGDILLAGALGMWCPPLAASLGVAFGAGLTLVMALLLKARRQTRLPFGPGLASGFIIALILETLI